MVPPLILSLVPKPKGSVMHGKGTGNGQAKGQGQRVQEQEQMRSPGQGEEQGQLPGNGKGKITGNGQAKGQGPRGQGEDPGQGAGPRRDSQNVHPYDGDPRADSLIFPGQGQGQGSEQGHEQARATANASEPFRVPFYKSQGRTAPRVPGGPPLLPTPKSWYRADHPPAKHRML